VETFFETTARLIEKDVKKVVSDYQKYSFYYLEQRSKEEGEKEIPC
jgi:hypothetical protein